MNKKLKRKKMKKIEKYAFKLSEKLSKFLTETNTNIAELDVKNGSFIMEILMTIEPKND